MEVFQFLTGRLVQILMSETKPLINFQQAEMCAGGGVMGVGERSDRVYTAAAWDRSHFSQRTDMDSPGRERETRCIHTPVHVYWNTVQWTC